ncbi:MAG: META domain-containing protein [Armatimonadetes bacterium]|nr:META domain-containing protein [Armatimonadota bacterium]
MRVQTLTASLVLLAVLAPVCNAQVLAGTWKVESFTTRTKSLDGKTTVKGPFTFKENDMTVTIDGKSYSEKNGDKVTTYSLSKRKGGCLLTRKNEGELIQVQLSEIHVFGDKLSLVSTRINKARKERTIVKWAMVRAHSDTISGVEWKLVEIAYNDDTTLKPFRGERLTMMVANGRVSGMAGANRYGGPAKVGKDGTVEFGPLVSTLVADPEGSIAPKFLKDLGQVKRFMFHKGDLILELPVDVGVLRFRRS